MKFLILLLIFCVGANCQAPKDCNSTFLIFIGNTFDDNVNVSLTSDVAQLKGTGFMGLTPSRFYNPALPTVIYTNGWRLNYRSDDVKAVLGNYIQARRSAYNLVYLDWSQYTNNFVYITSLGAMPGVNLIICLY